MKSDPKPPKREAEDPPPWVDPPQELSEEHAIRKVLNGEGLLVLGIGGVGKTHFMQELVAQLWAQEKRVDVISKTHLAS
jgi:GTPase SAR1 family protein